MSSAIAKAAEPSMEEILASIRRIIADDSDAATGDVDATEAEPLALDLTIADTATESGHASADDLTAREVKSLPPLIDLDLEEVTFDQPAVLDEPPPAPEPAPPPPVEPPPAAASAPPPPRPETLISTEATASIGQAFNMLSHTVLTQNARTLEDLVKDMLKPMLKTWLDDNLPPMVERLIRAEIERVARGR